MATALGGLMVYRWEDPDCAARLRAKLADATTSILRLGINHSDAARIQWQNAAKKYQERWAQGDLDGIVPVLSDLVVWLRRAGIDPSANAEVKALLNDPVFASGRGRVTTISGHAKLLELFGQLARNRESDRQAAMS
jgi:hypothetical protein